MERTVCDVPGVHLLARSRSSMLAVEVSGVESDGTQIRGSKLRTRAPVP